MSPTSSHLTQNQTMRILNLILSLLILIIPSLCVASPILVTISETNNGETMAWWPKQFGLDKPLTEAMLLRGLEVIEPASSKNKPKLSPVVYGQKTLSSANARTLGSLFGVSTVLNGNIEYHCSPAPDNRHSCTADARLALLLEKQSDYPIHIKAEAIASDKDLAIKIAQSKVIAQIALPILNQTKPKGDIPAIIERPMIIFNSLPDADMLVLLRKRLKRVAGVNDIAERWISDGRIALDINPDAPPLDSANFSKIIQQFATEIDEGITVREVTRSDMGVVFEAVRN